MNGSAVFEGPNGVSFRSPTRPPAADGRPSIYGIRPEHFTIADDGAEAEIMVVRADRLRNAGRRQARRRQKSSPCSANGIKFNPGDKIRLDPTSTSSICSTRRRGNVSLHKTEHNGGNEPMTDFTRRALVQGGTAFGAAAALSGSALLDWAKAWAQEASGSPKKAPNCRCCAGNISCSPKTTPS